MSQYMVNVVKEYLILVGVVIETFILFEMVFGCVISDTY